LGGYPKSLIREIAIVINLTSIGVPGRVALDDHFITRYRTNGARMAAVA
jgi:hypothetical protein